MADLDVGRLGGPLPGVVHQDDRRVLEIVRNKLAGLEAQVVGLPPELAEAFRGDPHPEGPKGPPGLLAHLPHGHQALARQDDVLLQGVVPQEHPPHARPRPRPPARPPEATLRMRAGW